MSLSLRAWGSFACCSVVSASLSLACSSATGGSTSSGGSSASGGAGGSATGGSSGSTTGGVGGTGTGGAGGAGTGGVAGSSTTGGAAGSATTGGTSGAGGAAGSAGGGTGGTGTGGTGTGGTGTGGTGTGGTGPCGTCSADGRNVLDCNGGVAVACTPTQVCASGACVTDLCNPVNQTSSTSGCDYWSLNPDNILPGACFAAFVTNNWDHPVHLKVDRDNTQLQVGTFTRIPNGQGAGLQYGGYSEVAGLAPGNVAILFLAQTPQFPPPLGEPCPAGITPAITVDPAIHGTGFGKAFHISADGPIVAYQMFPYGGGNAAITSATVLLPTTSWGTNYIAVNAYSASQIPSNPRGQPSLDLLAKEDGTQVTISPLAAIAGGGGVPASAQGVPVTYNLARGQFVQITQPAELTGSAILANKPIAVFGGNACMNIPNAVDACDMGHQQLPPLQAMGNEYVGVRYPGRGGGSNESSPYRIVGAVDGTVLTYTPSAPPGAPATLSQGMVVEFSTSQPFVVSSQDADHPFYLASYMTGGTDFNGEGDPEFVNVVPTVQYLKEYVFFTDPTYPETHLVLVRAATAGNFSDVTLDCSGVVQGWTTVGNYQYARLDLVKGNFVGQNGCSNGRHHILSDSPFAVTVWGWGSIATVPRMSQWVSYAYPAGAGVKPVTTREVPPEPR